MHEAPEGQPERFERGEEHGQSLLSQISNEMVQAMKHYYGKGPTKAKSYMLDDFLITVLRGGVLPAEKTMLEAGREDSVREFRQEFQNEMGAKLIGMVEDVTGRTVVNYQSQVLFDPDLIIEIFVFDRPADEDQVRETAEGQLGERSTGEVRTEDVAADIPHQPDR